MKYFAFLSLAAGLAFSAVAAGAPPYATSQTTPKVAIETTFGDITIELFPTKAPITCNNFLQYVNSGFYDGLIIHRVTNSTTFQIIQGGGYYFENGSVNYKSEGLLPPIINESTNGLSNLRATVAMARTTDPNSATSQFYINVINNTFLDHTPTNAGYCVFGQVVSGMNVVDQIEQLPIFPSNPSIDPNDGIPYYLSNGQPYPVNVYKQQVRVCVSSTGNDSTGIGSPDAPFKTIQKGIDIIASPGHVVPSPATYTGPNNVDLDFKRKAITVRAIEPRDFNTATKTTIDCRGSSTNMHRAFYFHTTEDANSVVKGLTIINGYQTSGGAILCQSSSPTIKNCTFTNNTASNLGGGIYCNDSHAVISNCTFSKNTALSRGGALCVGDGSNAILNNSILWNNIAPSGNEIALNGLAAQAAITISYSDIKGGQAGVYKATGNTVIWGPGNLDTDPCFVNYDGNNLNLQSTVWQWDDANGWSEGKNNSLCIDAGNPGSSIGDEGITSANVRINMGAAGGTVKASLPPDEWRLLADIDNDGITNNNDFAWFARYWLTSGSELPADFDRNGIVDIADLQLFADDWTRMGNTRLSDKADFNLDGIVNFRDFAGLAADWQKSATHKTSDLNGDGIVNIDDLDLFTQVWLQ